MKIYAVKLNSVMWRKAYTTPEKAEKLLNKLGYYADNDDLILFHKENYTAYIVELELE